MKKWYAALLAVALTVGAILVSAQDSPPVNVVGEWTMSLTFVKGTAEHMAVIAQEGEKLTGTYKGTRLEGPLSGRVVGDTVELYGRLSNESTDVTFHYTGKVAGDTMSGIVDMGEYWTAAFTAQKKKK